MNKMNQPVCTVIGTSNKMGWNIARDFASRGFKIAFVGWSRRSLDFFKDRSDSAGFKSDAFFLEDAKNGTLERSLRKIRKELGNIDVMVYNESVWSPSFREFTQENSIWGDLRINESWAYTAINEVYTYMRDNRRGRIYFTTPEFSPNYRRSDRRFRSTQENFKRIAFDLRRNGIWFAFTSPSYEHYTNQGQEWYRNQNTDYHNNYSQYDGYGARHGYKDYGYRNNVGFDMSPRDWEYRNGWINQWNDLRWDGQYANNWNDQMTYQRWGPNFNYQTSNWNNNGWQFWNNQNWNDDSSYDSGFDGRYEVTDSFDDYGHESVDFSYHNNQSRNPQNV